MIIVKSNQITIISPGGFNNPGENYSLLLQDKYSKQVYIYNLVSESQSKLYWRFTNNFNLPDNDYEYILIYNPVKLDIYLNQILDNSTIDNPRILTVGDDILTCGVFILTAGKDAPDPVKILDKGILRVGDYKASTIDYKYDKKYIVYEG